MLVSNPFRAATSSAAALETTMGWTRTTYDQNGRSVSTQRYTGMSLPAPWGSSAPYAGVTTSYSAQNTLVMDEAGNTRNFYFDGLGRLQKVTEDPGSSKLVDKLRL